MTPALAAAVAAGDEVVVVTKPASRALLEPAFPQVTWIEWTAPWTAHHGKYHLWRWRWLAFFRVVNKLRQMRFTDGWSVRPDPRDHALLFLVGAAHRRSFQHRWSKAFLNEPLLPADTPRHRSEDWIELARAAGLTPPERPTLPASAYVSALPEGLTALHRPWAVLHTGAGQPTRRWPEDNWRAVVDQLRATETFSLILIPDPTGHGDALRDAADITLDSLSLPALAATLAAADCLLAHDSGPMHIAAAMGTPVFAVFGPGMPEQFGPRHPEAAVLHDPQCPHYPCRDFCRFEEPRCLTKLTPELCNAKLQPWAEKWLRPAPENPLNAGDE